MKFKLTLVGTLAVATLLTTSPSQAYTPTTNNLVLWLKTDTLSLSNGDPVSLWPDSSPAGNNATQSDTDRQGTFAVSAINGEPAVQFSDDNHQHDGDDDFLGVTRTTFPSGFTYVAVFSTLNTTTLKAYGGNAGNTIIGDHHPAVRNSFGVTGGKAEFNVYDESTASFHSLQSAASVADGKGHITIGTLATTGPQNMNLYLDGLLVGSGTRTVLPAGLGFDRISGGYRDGTDTLDTFDGFIGEVLVYDRVLSATERQDAYEYLLATYALPEPSSALLLVAGAVMLWRRDRKKE